jgi:hypothetical protein
MAEQNELHFETIDRNKDINMQRNKIKYLEDRITTLEKTLESHAKILARFQMTEGITMPNKHFCQGPTCHEKPTQDRFLKSRGVIRGRYAYATMDGPNQWWHAFRLR